MQTVIRHRVIFRFQFSPEVIKNALQFNQTKFLDANHFQPQPEQNRNWDSRGMSAFKKPDSGQMRAANNKTFLISFSRNGQRESLNHRLDFEFEVKSKIQIYNFIDVYRCLLPQTFKIRNFLQFLFLIEINIWTLNTSLRKVNVLF